MKTQPIDTSFAQAAQVLINRDRAQMILIGCGGTGSWLAPAIARLQKVLLDNGREMSCPVFCDPDHVEEVNIPRQNFCAAEIGQNKAVALATRYGAAWGVEIAAAPAAFSKSTLTANWGTRILIGCVDNAAARKAISLYASGHSHAWWWLDCGNSDESGQVLLGSAGKAARLEGAFPAKRTCVALPSPALQHPELLKPRPEERADTKLSCAERQLANLQSLAINQRVAAEAADYLMRMLLGRPLKRFATYFDLATGSARSRPVTPEEVGKVIGKPTEFLVQRGLTWER